MQKWLKKLSSPAEAYNKVGAKVKVLQKSPNLPVNRGTILEIKGTFGLAGIILVDPETNTEYRANILKDAFKMMG